MPVATVKRVRGERLLAQAFQTYTRQFGQATLLSIPPLRILIPSFLSSSISQEIALLLCLRLSVQTPVRNILILSGWRNFLQNVLLQADAIVILSRNIPHCRSAESVCGRYDTPLATLTHRPGSSFIIQVGCPRLPSSR